MIFNRYRSTPVGIPVAPRDMYEFREIMKAPISDWVRGFNKTAASSGITLGILIPFRKSFTCLRSPLQGYLL